MNGAPVVAGFERFHRQQGHDLVAGGMLLLGELCCTSCHTAVPPADKALLHRPAPRLRRVAERIHHDRLRALIGDPHGTKRGTTMPNVWRGVPAQQRDREVDAIVHFLVAKRLRQFELTQTDPVAADRGAKMFDQVGCAACHAPANGATPAGSVPIAKMANRSSFSALWRFLRNPHATRPGARMPALGLRDKEAQDIAHHLLRGTQVPGALKYTVFHNALDSLDDVDERNPKSGGVVDGFDPSVARRRSNYLLRFEGYVQIPRDGTYSFYIRSDDGSRLWIDGDEVLDNDGVRRNHKPRTATGKVALTAGWHAITLEYFQRGREAVLEVEWKGPRLPRARIPRDALQHTRQPIEPPSQLTPDTEKVATGRRAFVQRGCVACHTDVIRNARGRAAKPLTALRAGRGCLSEQAGAKGPDFRLDAGQRAAIAAAIADIRADGTPASDARTRTHRVLKTFHCYACHSRDGLGGVPEDRDAVFTSHGTDLGDEGRIPPTLTGVGDRLQRKWLDKVLTKGAPVRPYIATRMPHFDAKAVAGLTTDLVALDRKKHELPEVEDTADASREAGHRLMGMNGLMCIACHDFNRRKALSLGVTDLVTATERLHRDWFDRFMRNPEKFHPGTRMPALWPNGRGSLTDVMGGDASRQIHALWRYFEDGSRAVDPEGLNRQSHELIVGGEAIVYRGKLWEAGFRGIAVGYPEKVNLAFDAQEMRLALLWKGRFLDVTAHWDRQGMGRVRPRGSDVRVFVKGAPFAELATQDAAWPEAIGATAGYRFRGYDLDEKRRPTFRYEYRGMGVEDTPLPRETDGKLSIVRTFTFKGERAMPNLWMRVARAKRIEAKETNDFVVDGKLTVHVRHASDRGPRIRTVGENRELLAPVGVRAGVTRLVLEYTW